MSAGTVMVVEDDEALRESLCELLEDVGYTTVPLANGLAALRRLRAETDKPDVILLDLMMPGMNGWQFRDEQLRDPALSDIPVIVMTATRDLRDIPADEVVHKPLKLDRLLEVVRRRSAPSPRPVQDGPAPPALDGRIGELEAGLRAGDGEMGALVRAMVFRPPLGPIESWPRSLQLAASLCLASKYQVILFWGRDLIQIYNDAFIAILGRKHPKALGQGARECWPEMWDTIAPMFEHVFTTGTATRSDNIHLPVERHGYLEESFYTMSYTPVFLDTGEVGGVFNVILETTQQVVAERRIRTMRDLAARTADAKSPGEACSRAALALAENPDIRFALFYLLDPQTDRLTLVDAVGIAPGGPASPPDVAASARDPWPFAEVLRSARPSVVRGVDRRFGSLAAGPWGQPVETAVVLPLARPRQGRPWGVLVAGVTPQRPLDDDFRSFLDQIAAHVATAIGNAHAYEEERARAEALAEIDRAKTAFFSNISHEFRTPLTLMLGPTEDLLAGAHGDLDADKREQLALIHRNELRLQKLVNALLDFSRIEAGRLQASYAPVDLAKLTQDLASTFRSAVERAGVELSVDCARIDEPVFVDRDMWEKIVLNLLSNALKFTFEGKIGVTLRQEGARAVLRVSDTGVGIAAADLPHVFERFHRVEGTRARTHEGSGIGLALVQELAKLHGGAVHAESQVGAGTTVTVSIPLGSAHLPSDRTGPQQDAASASPGAASFVEEAMRWLPPPGGSPAAAEAPSAVADPSTASGPSGSPARVLLADDNADMREYVRRLLSPHWVVEAVGDGQRALEIARARPPDLVLTDVMMSGLDGFALLRALREDERTSRIPVIMLSARAGEEAMLEGFAAGAEDYLFKPFSARELLARVRSQIELARLRKEVQERQAHLYSVFMQAPAMACVLRGPDLVFEMANDMYRRVVGRKDVVGKPLLEAIPELRGQGLDELIRDVMRTGEPFVGKERHIRLDRTGTGHADDTYWTVIHAPLHGPSGEPRVVMLGHDVTDQVVARRQAQQNEARFRAIVEQVEAGIAEVDLSGRFTFVNDRFRQIVGRSSQELFHSHVHDITHPDDLAATAEGLRRVIEVGAPFFIEKRYVKPDGSIVWVTKSYSRLEDDEGRPRGVALAAIDTTQRKYAERALMESEAEAHTLLRISEALGESQTDLETLVQRVTDEATAVIGAKYGAFFYKSTRLDGESYVLYTLSGAPREAFARFGLPRNTLLFGPTFGGAGIVRLDDVTRDPRYGKTAPHYGMPAGHVPVKSYLAAPVVARSGTVLGGLFFGHPERARFTAAHERLVGAIASSAAVAIENAQLLRASREAEEIQARRARQASLAGDIGAAFTQGGDLRAVLQRCCDLSVEHLDLAFARVWTPSADGSVLELQASAGMYRHLDGAHSRIRIGQLKIGAIGQERRPHLTNDVLGDPRVSDPDWARREGMVAFAGYPLVVEDRLLGVLAMFARRPFADDTFAALGVVARTMAIGIERARSDEQRSRLLRDLQQTVQFSETFVGILGHDLRNPLGAIVTSAELLLRRETSERISRPIERIRTSADRMGRMIEQILDFTRARIGGGIPLAPAPVHLERLVRQLVEELEVAAPQEIVLDHRGAMEGEWDADRLAQVISNLLGNAVEHGETGAPIRVELDGTSPDVVRIVVANAGTIPESLLASLFDPFRRASAHGRTHGSKGLGLGLYIVQQIVVAHGGRIEARSGGGETSFSIELPRASRGGAVRPGAPGGRP